MSNVITNGHKKLNHTISSLSDAAVKKSAAVQKSAMDHYSDAKDMWEDVNDKVHANPWKAIVAVTAAAALIGFCFGLCKRKY